MVKSETQSHHCLRLPPLRVHTLTYLNGRLTFLTLNPSTGDRTTNTSLGSVPTDGQYRVSHGGTGRRYKRFPHVYVVLDLVTFV